MRKVMAAMAAGVLVVGAGIVLDTTSADAHGATIFPGSRQYLCWVDGLEDTGEIVPKNPACADAVAQSDGGATPLYNWFANLDPNGQGRTEGYIPDGEICSGGNNGPYDFSAYNMMRTDWPLTHVTAGATYQFRHNNWAQHPGRFDVYVTVEGWDPLAPLSWSDLELIDSVQDPDQIVQGDGLGYYYWDVAFPADRSGRHTVFVHWIRSDSPENFYSCSDIVFDGGNGEVTGIGDQDGTDPDDPPTVPGQPSVSNVTATGAAVSWGGSDGTVTAYEVVNVADGSEEVLATVSGGPPPTTAALSGLTPETSYEIAVRARNDNTGLVTELSSTVTFTTPDQGGDPGTCEVDYEVSEWDNHPGFTTSVTIINTGSSTIDGWTLQWDYSAGQVVDEPGWSATVSQEGATVTAVNESWTSTIPAQGAVTFGFNAEAIAVGNNPPPGVFTLDGTVCSLAD